MSWVLWVAILSGNGLTMTHQRFDSRQACEAAAADVRKMPLIREKLETAKGGYAVFRFDHVCSPGASAHQGAE